MHGLPHTGGCVTISSQYRVQREVVQGPEDVTMVGAEQHQWVTCSVRKFQTFRTLAKPRAAQSTMQWLVIAMTHQDEGQLDSCRATCHRVTRCLRSTAC